MATAMTTLPASLHLGEVLLSERVRVDLQEDGGEDADPHWHGTLTAGPDVHLSIGSTCFLTFADGRRGEILITRLAYRGRADDIKVQFRGVGPLRS